ncbi:DNA-binding response regulator [Paenibacillus montaniterrae]|uniref:DNA-binding response regulator n=1 Tax=Paenibacillus montaniterrae TaxID=429341 RepID=A0A919YJZ7_9BACL|nr:response regulator transcription factor [Paenibacillus montaniterrae]GIP15797.1 DNA-binding response regulator [Paenibacillus montaniterrae]
MSNASCRILIIDDHEHAREGIRTIIGQDPHFIIVAEGASGEEAISLTELYMPDLILMDIQMPGMGGLEATKQLKNSFPYIKIIMVTVSDDITHLFEAIKHGAQGYLLKNLQPSAWHDYLHAVALDEAPVTKELAFRMLKEFAANRASEANKHPLTAREQDILRLVAKGYVNREIAAQLDISEHTVKNHLKNILQKLHLSNRVQLTRYAYEQGWVHDK